MRRHYRGMTIAFAALASGLGFASTAEARPMSVRTLAAEELRLSTIAYRIATANVAVCPKREALSGLVLHDLTRYDLAIRPAASRAFSMRGGVGILGIVPGSVAAEAGLRVDDEIIAVGPYSVEDPQAFARAKSFARMEQFDRLFQSAMTHGVTDLRIRRQGIELRVPLRAAHGCGGKLTLSSSNQTNAWADGRNVLITTAMTAMSRSEDEIAFVIAHEMAHNILGHVGDTKGKRGIFGGKVKRGEIEADDFAVELMSNGGYQPAGGISFLETARRKMWWAISFDHPGFGRRIAIVNAAIQRHAARDAAMAAAQKKGAAQRPLLSIGS